MCQGALQAPPHGIKSSKAIITLDHGKHFTLVTFHNSTSASPAPPPPLPDPTAYTFSLFNTFILRNSFTGQSPENFLPEVQSLIKAPRSPLLPAIQALGAVQARNHRAALQFYTHSITSLRHTLSLPGAAPRTTVLWTTFFLGLFELMTDVSGVGWIQHMVHGTSKALIAGGPGVCLSGGARSFFLQARPFEVCRSVIFNETSFLGEPEWRTVPGGQGTRAEAEDEVLSLIVSCSNLRVRTAEFIDNLSNPPTLSDRTTGLILAEEGFHLRTSLLQAQTPSLLSTILLAATSIYLSGNYDYDLLSWHALRVAVPILDDDAVKVHWQSIISASQEALGERTLSPLLLLFPLRVAGARSHTIEQQAVVDTLLCKVAEEFVVAEAFLEQLREIWTMRNGSTI